MNPTSDTSPIDPITIGKKVKEIYKDGVDSRGVPYAQIPDVELGSKYLLKNGDAGIKALGIDTKSGSQQNLSKVMRQGGSEFINKGKTKDERYAIADEISSAGGLNEYRKALPLIDLANTEEKKGLTASSDLMAKIDRASTAMQDKGFMEIGGTGPGAQFIPDALRSDAGREKVADVANVAATYQQMISGKVISEPEAKRLSAFLPTKAKSESQNAQDLQRLKDGLDLNLTLFEKGKREGLTANEAYAKYGKDILKSQLDKKVDKKPNTSGVDNPAYQAIKGNGVADFLLGGAANVAQDIGNSIRVGNELPAITTREQSAKLLEKQAINEKDPKRKVEILRQANALRSQISNQAGNLSQNFSPDVNNEPVGRSVNAATEVASLAELPAIVTGTKKLVQKAVSGELPKIALPGSDTLKNAGKYLTTTKGKTVKAMGEAVQEGDSLNWENITKKAQEYISNKGTPAQKELNKLIAQETPGGLGKVEISSPAGLELRQGLGSRLPSNYFENALSKAISGGQSEPRNAATDALRHAVSDELKRAAPKIKGPDQMYALIKKMHGDAPTWGKRIVAGATANYIADKLGLKGPASEFVGLLAAGGAGIL